MISLAELQRRIDSGDLSADAAIAQSSEAIDALGQDHRRFCLPSRDRPRGKHRVRCAASRSASRTSSIPRTFRPRWALPIYRGWRPRADAPVVMMLKQAGATIIGKTTTTAFAANDPTPTLNPHNHGHTPGGSSSGSAAAVGAGMIPLALGTQTGGSVIRPASFCGVAAIKPTYRMLPTVGREMFFVDAGYRRSVRGRRPRPGARTCRP